MTDNTWAYGCEQCSFGIVSAPKIIGSIELYLERMVQMIAGDVTFCNCKAGGHNRANLRNNQQRLIEEARQDPRMQYWAERGTHPDIESAKKHLMQSYEMLRMPTIHLDK